MKLSSKQVAAIKLKQESKKWSPKLPFSSETIKLLQNRPGNYVLMNMQGKKIYVGSSTELRHRVESYNEMDDFTVHPTKEELREHIHYFRFRYMPLKQDQIAEKRIKQKLQYNMDSKKNEEIKREKK